jgi:hypothetical protein
MTLASSGSVAHTEGNRISGAPAYGLFMPGVAASVFFLLKAIPRHTNTYKVEVGLALLLLVLGFVGLSDRALGHRVTASVCAFVVLCSYWTLTFFLLFAFASATPAAILYFWFWTLPPVIISVAATISFANRVGSRWALSSVGVGLVCGVFVAGMAIGTKSRTLSSESVPALSASSTQGSIR